ncbi:MAG: Trm112 family protein [Acidilobaceae archaeon]
MRYYFFELLACPACKSVDLELHSIVEERREVNVEVEKVRCRKLCSLHRKPADQVPLSECASCVHRDVLEGVIVCKNCGRWYPIVEGIPVMLVDKYRNPREDEVFVRRNLEKIPQGVLKLMKYPRVLS